MDEITRYLRTETVGGIIMLAATVLALVLANTPLAATYHSVNDTVLGLPALHLELSVSAWFADGLLAVFFFVAGLELKRELVVGELRTPKKAMLPMFAAVGGMAVPALIAVAITLGRPGGEKAWAIPLATDIAFALAILAVTASALPTTVRVLLLSLAVVDDLGAILVIATVFSDTIHLLALGIAVVLLAFFAVLQARRVQGAWTYLVYAPLALAVWYFVHEAGVHATVAGVAFGLLTRVKKDADEHEAPATRLEHRIQPWSAGLVVPLFALSAAGVTFSANSMGRLFTEPVALGIMAGLVIGKPLGVMLGAWLSVRLGLAKLPTAVGWRDVFAIGVLAGVGFTVSLLISELAFTVGPLADTAKTAVLVASAVASILGALVLRVRVRRRADVVDPV